MVKLSILIDSGNAGIQSQAAVTKAVKEALDRIKKGDTEGKVMDVNGNSVGTFSFQK